MSKRMGEFEERPTIKEAVPIPLQKQRPTGWIVATIVFALAAICATGFIIVDKINSKKIDLGAARSATGSGLEGGLGEASDGARKGFYLRENIGNIYITKKGDVYLEPVENVIEVANGKQYMRAKDYDQSKLPGKYGTYTLTEEDIESSQINPNTGEEEAVGHDLKFDGYKLDVANIISVEGPLGFGQAWNGYNYAFIGFDGSVDWLHIDPKFQNEAGSKAGAILTKKVGGYSDVVRVMRATKRGSGGSIMIVKKNGEQIWMSAELLSAVEGSED